MKKRKTLFHKLSRMCLHGLFCVFDEYADFEDALLQTKRL